MSSGKVLIGVLAGMAVGALLGVLFAPDKGSETRKKMAEKGGELADEVSDKFMKLIDELNQKIDAAKAKADENSANANEAAD